MDIRDRSITSQKSVSAAELVVPSQPPPKPVKVRPPRVAFDDEELYALRDDETEHLESWRHLIIARPQCEGYLLSRRFACSALSVNLYLIESIVTCN